LSFEKRKIAASFFQEFPERNEIVDVYLNGLEHSFSDKIYVLNG
jgi:hypothetical protein